MRDVICRLLAAEAERWLDDVTDQRPDLLPAATLRDRYARAVAFADTHPDPMERVVNLARSGVLAAEMKARGIGAWSLPTAQKGAPIPLRAAGYTHVRAWQCGVCCAIYSTRGMVEKCHPPCACGKVVGWSDATACQECAERNGEEATRKMEAVYAENDRARIAALPTVPWPTDGRHAFSWAGHPEQVPEEDAGSLPDYCERKGIPLPTRCEVWELAVADIDVTAMLEDWIAGFDDPDEVRVTEEASDELAEYVRAWAEKHNLREWRSTGTAAEYDGGA